MSSIEFYDKKTCGTCKKAKAFLDSCQIEYNVIEINKTPPPKDILEKYIDENNLKPFVNSRSAIYREKEFSKKGLPNKKELIELMLEHPDLIKRPVVIKGEQVYFGFNEDDLSNLK